MGGIRILLYHSVGEVDPRDKLGIRIDKERFHSHMRILKEGNYNIWMLKDVVNCIKRKDNIPPKTAVITFDDGYKDNILNAAPIMEEFNFRAAFFVTVGYIGGVKTNPRRDWQHWECMDRDDLKALIDMGHDIGSHGYRHINLCKITKEAKEKELRSSKEELSSLVNNDIEFFSYPYGYFDDEILRIVEDKGYKAACTTVPGINRHSIDLYKLKRIEIMAGDTGDDFRRKLERRYD